MASYWDVSTAFLDVAGAADCVVAESLVILGVFHVDVSFTQLADIDFILIQSHKKYVNNESIRSVSATAACNYM